MGNLWAMQCIVFIVISEAIKSDEWVIEIEARTAAILLYLEVLFEF